MDVTISLDVLRQAGHKRPGFWMEATAVGIIEGDRLRLPQEIFQELNIKHFGSRAAGNIVHSLAQPIAKATGLENCLGCADRQVKLNTALARTVKL